MRSSNCQNVIYVTDLINPLNLVAGSAGEQQSVRSDGGPDDLQPRRDRLDHPGGFLKPGHNFARRNHGSSSGNICSGYNKFRFHQWLVFRVRCRHWLIESKAA